MATVQGFLAKGTAMARLHNKLATRINAADETMASPDAEEWAWRIMELMPQDMLMAAVENAMKKPAEAEAA